MIETIIILGLSSIVALGINITNGKQTGYVDDNYTEEETKIENLQDYI